MTDEAGKARDYFELPVINEFPLTAPPPPEDELHLTGVVPPLHSKPGAAKKLFLDFDGHLFVGPSPWGANRVTPPYSIDSDPAFSSAEAANIVTIWKRVSEDFAPFDIDITTEEPASFGSATAQRVAIGGAWSDWYGSSAGGVAYISTFGWSGDIPCYVFEENLGNGDPKYTAEAISHEAGHTLSLYHHSTYSGTTKTAEYDPGSGSGVTAWAPIMGVGYYNNLTTWHNGPNSSCSTCLQDDIQQIINIGVPLRSDDVPATFAGAVALTVAGTSVVGNGIIGTTSDTDMFKVTVGAGAISLQVDPASPGPNLDIVLDFYDGSQALIAQSNAADLSGTISIPSAAAGTYYLAVRSVGTYGRVGQYKITGTIASTGGSDVTPPTAVLTAPSQATAGETSHLLTVTYSDNVAVKGSSISTNDIIVTGPSGYSEVATLFSVDSTADGTPRVAVYKITPPGGSWDNADNGTYTVTLQTSEIRDTAGNFTATGSLGTFIVNMSDAVAPTASIYQALNVTTAGSTTYSFQIRYLDNSAVKVSTIGSGDVRVLGPSSFNAAGQFFAVDSTSDGPSRLVTYTITPPGGSWDAADAGTYTIQMQANEVADVSNNKVASGNLGTFTVSMTSYNLTGLVRDGSSNPIAGVTVQGGSLGTRTTGADGRFSFGAVPGGTNYSVTPTSASLDFTPPTRSGTLNAAADLLYTGALKTYQYTGSVTFKGTPVPSFTVSSTIGSADTNTAGYYQLPSISHGSALTVSANEPGYVTNEGSYSVVAGTGGTQLSFTVKGCASGYAEYSVASSPRCLVDTDGDGLSDVEESARGTNGAQFDSDGDGQGDGYEVGQGSDPLDRGSYGDPVLDEAYIEWNNFLGGLYNIVEYTSEDDATSSVTATLRDIDGVPRDQVSFSLLPRGKFDLLAHEMNGFILNSYGLVHSVLQGKINGGMIYYKRPLAWGGNPNEFSFAVLFEFTKGLAGVIDTPFNSYHASLRRTVPKLAANWAQVTNVGAVASGGVLSIVDLAGRVLCTRRLELAPSQRRDTSIHAPMPGDTQQCRDSLGPDKVGVVRWTPDRNDVPHLVRVVRYLYNNDGSVNDFASAFQLTARIPSTEPLTVTLDTREGTAVVEVSNGASVPNVITVTINAASGAVLRTFELVLGPLETRHIIADDILVRSIGSATVRGTVPQSLVVVGMHYGRDANGDVKWMYGVNGARALDSEISGAYNSYLNQGCNALIASTADVDDTLTARVVRSDGTVIRSGDPIFIPAHGTIEYNCRVDEANRYGTLAFTSSGKRHVGHVIRVGEGNRFRIPSPLK